MRTFVSSVAFLVPLVVGCAAAPPPPPAPPPPAVEVAAAVVDAPPKAPVDEDPVASCDKPEGDDGADAACFPGDAYRTWLCSRSDPRAAVSLFKKGTPWMRAYVSRDLESWDPSRRTKKSRLSLDEEVIVLHPYKPAEGAVTVVTSNSSGLGWTSLDAVRADGTCVSLMPDEITTKRPPAPKHAAIAWDKLNEHARTELLASPELRKKADQMAKACAKAGEPCTKAKSRLTDAVVAAAL